MPNPTTIDSLAIEIGASSASAEQAINKLASSLERLKKAVGGRTPALSKWADELRKVADATKDMESSSVSLSKTASAFQKLAAVKNVKIPAGLGKSLKEISESAAGITPDSVENLDKLTRAVQRLSNIKAENIKAFRLFKVPYIPENAGAGIESIANSMNSLTDASLERLGKFADVMERLSGVDFTGLAYLQGLNMPQSGGGMLSSLFGEVSPAMAVAWKAFTVIGSVAKAAVYKILEFAKAIGKTLLNALKSATTAAAKLAKNLISLPFSALKSKISGFVKSLNNIVNSLKRIAFYRIIRTVIKEIGEALKEGTENAYWFSKNIGDATKYISEAYDSFSSATFKMKNQTGAAWATLFANIQPFTNQIVESVTRAMGVVTQFFAVLGGKSTYLKAIDYSKDWAEESEKGAKAAKEWRNQLMGFDELNRLEAPTDTNRGSGNNALEDYESMFEEVPIDSWFQDIMDMLKSGKWDEVGRAIGDKFNAWVDNFKWAEWGKKIGFGIQKGIDLAYNFLTQTDFKNLGNRIAEFLDNLGDQIDFNWLGRLAVRIKTAILDVLYGAFTRPGSMGNLARNISDFLIGALSEAADWLESLDHTAISNAIRDFFNNIKGEEIKGAFVRVIKDAWELAVSAKEDLFPNGLVATVTGYIKDFFSGVNWDEVKETIKTGLQTAWEWATKTFDEIWPPAEREEFKEMAVEKIKEIGSAIGKALWEGIVSAVDSVKEGFAQTTVGKIYNAIEFAFMAGSGLGTVKEFVNWWLGIGEKTGESAAIGIKNGVSDNGKQISEKFESVGKDAGDGFGVGFSKIIIDFAAGPAGALFNFFIDEVRTALDSHSPSRKFEEIGSDAGEGFKIGFETTLKDAISSIAPLFEKLFMTVSIGITEKIPAMASRVATGLKTVGESISNGFKGIISNIKSTLGIGSSESSVFSNIGKSMVNGLRTGFTSLWSSFTTTATTLVLSLAQTIINAVSTAISTASANISSMVSSARSTLSSLASSARESISNIVSSSHYTLNNIVSSVSSALNNLISQARFRVSSITNRSYATGGFPEDGLFYANHSELVGRFSNGKTAVANNEQIVEGIRQGVFEAVTAAMSMNQSDDKTVVPEIHVYLDSREIKAGQNRLNRALGVG